MGSSSLRNFLVIAGAVFIGGWVTAALTLAFTHQVIPALLTEGSREWRVSAVVGTAFVVPYLIGGVIVGVLAGLAEPGIKPFGFLLGVVGLALVWLYAPLFVTLAVHGKYGQSPWAPARECAIVIGVGLAAFLLTRRSRTRPVA